MSPEEMQKLEARFAKLDANDKRHDELLANNSEHFSYMTKYMGEIKNEIIEIRKLLDSIVEDRRATEINIKALKSTSEWVILVSKVILALGVIAIGIWKFITLSK